MHSRTDLLHAPLNSLALHFYFFSIIFRVYVLPVRMSPFKAFELLFFAVFGQTLPEAFRAKNSPQPEWTLTLFKLVSGIYMLLSVVVLINLLIAMMSDTYQRIQVPLCVHTERGATRP